MSTHVRGGAAVLAQIPSVPRIVTPTPAPVLVWLAGGGGGGHKLHVSGQSRGMFTAADTIEHVKPNDTNLPAPGKHQ